MQSQPETKKWIIPAIGTMFAWGFWAFIPKLALQSMQPISVIFYEAVGSILVITPVIIYLRGKIRFEKRGVGLTFLSATIYAAAALAFLYAMKTGPVAVIVTLTAMYPFVTVVTARLILKEKMNRHQLIAVALALVSIYLMSG